MAQTQALPLPQSVGKRIRYIRDDLCDMTQADLAAKVTAEGYPIDRWQIQRIERGQLPELDLLAAISLVLGFSVHDLGATDEDYPGLRVMCRMGFEPDRIPAWTDRRRKNWNRESGPDLRINARLFSLDAHRSRRA